jgi:hypothetical protein
MSWSSTLTLAGPRRWYVLADARRARRRRRSSSCGAITADAERASRSGADAWVDDDVHVVAAAGRLVPSIAA